MSWVSKMYVKSVCLDGKKFELKGGVNYIYGPNASGKSRLLHAIMKATPGVALITPDRVSLGKWKLERKQYQKLTPYSHLAFGEIEFILAEIWTAEAIFKKSRIICYDDMFERLDRLHTKTLVDFFGRVGKERQVFVTCREMPDGRRGNMIRLDRVK